MSKDWTLNHTLGGWTGQSELELPDEQQEAGLVQTDRWMCLSVVAQLRWQKAENYDLLAELLFTPRPRWIKTELEFYELRCLTFIWARRSARRDLCLQQRRKEKTTTNEVAWKCILMLRQQQTQRGMMGVRGRFILMKDKVINVVLEPTEMCLNISAEVLTLLNSFLEVFLEETASKLSKQTHNNNNNKSCSRDDVTASRRTAVFARWRKNHRLDISGVLSSLLCPRG